MKGRRRVVAMVAAVLCAAAPLSAQTGTAATSASTVETGEISGAAFRIETPSNWNRGLVMYAHGYTTSNGAWTTNLPAISSQSLLRR